MTEDNNINEFQIEGEFFAQIPHQVFDDKRFQENTHTLRAQSLIGYAYCRGRGYQFYRKNIAAVLGIGLRTLDRAISAAKELGYLTIVQHPIINSVGVTTGNKSVWKIAMPNLHLSDSDTRLPTYGSTPLPTYGSTPLPTGGNDSNINVSKNNVSKILNPTFVGDKNSIEDKDRFKSMTRTVYWLAKEVGLKKPEPDEVQDAVEILINRLAPIMGGSTTNAFRAALVEARDRIESGEDPAEWKVNDVALQVLVEHHT